MSDIDHNGYIYLWALFVLTFHLQRDIRAEMPPRGKSDK